MHNPPVEKQWSRFCICVQLYLIPDWRKSCHWRHNCDYADSVQYGHLYRNRARWQFKHHHLNFKARLFYFKKKGSNGLAFWKCCFKKWLTKLTLGGSVPPVICGTNSGAHGKKFILRISEVYPVKVLCQVIFNISNNG